MDAIAHGPFWRICGFKQNLMESSRNQATFGKEAWKQLHDLFEDDIEEGVMTFDFWAYNLLRVMAALFIPLWLVVGLITCGWLWPPQVREAFLSSTVFAHVTDLAKEDEQRRTQIVQLRQEVSSLREELLHELAMDRTHLVQLRNQVVERKADISNEMRDIKRLVALLFERQNEAYQ